MKLFWKFYAFFYFCITLSTTLAVINKSSLVGIYYNIETVFSGWFAVYYFLNIFSALINFTTSIFIFGYAFDIAKLSRLPQWFLYTSVALDCVGHSYEWEIVRSGFAQGALAGSIGLISLAILILPSYIAQWRITFKRP